MNSRWVKSVTAQLVLKILYYIKDLLNLSL